MMGKTPLVATAHLRSLSVPILSFVLLKPSTPTTTPSAAPLVVKETSSEFSPVSPTTTQSQPPPEYDAQVSYFFSGVTYIL